MGYHKKLGRASSLHDGNGDRHPLKLGHLEDGLSYELSFDGRQLEKPGIDAVTKDYKVLRISTVGITEFFDRGDED